MSFFILVFRMCIDEDSYQLLDGVFFFWMCFFQGVFFLGCAWRTRSERGWPPKAQSQARPWRRRATNGSSDRNILIKEKEGFILKEGVLIRKKGGRPLSEFLALFPQLHLWSLKRDYVFKKAIFLDFDLLFRLFGNPPFLGCFTLIVSL